MENLLSLHHQMQPDGITCGPTCVAMAVSILLERLGRDTNLTVLMIREMMGTNIRTGTTDVEMHKAMKSWGMEYERYSPLQDGHDRIEPLRQHLQEHGLAMLRVIKNGCRHWVLAVGAEDGFQILDPAEDRLITISEKEVCNMLKPRGWEIWLIPHDSPCRALNMRHVEEDNEISLRKEAIALTAQAFGNHVPTNYDFNKHLDNGVDFTLSVALCDEDKVLGVYLLNYANHDYRIYNLSDEKNETEFIDIAWRIEDEFRNLSGVEGISLVVSPDEQGLGYGKLLRLMPGEMGFEWCYGMQLKSLDNLNEWMSFRTQVYDLGHCWLTAGLVKPLSCLNAAPDAPIHIQEFKT